MRAENGFDYQVKVNASTEEAHEIKVPPSIVISFVENAILHGITPLKANGDIKVHFEVKANHVLCHITDNGIGREEARKKRNLNGHQSLGSKISAGQLSAMNADQPVYHDLLDQNGQPIGTTVQLKIPILTNEVHESHHHRRTIRSVIN